MKLNAEERIIKFRSDFKTVFHAYKPTQLGIVIKKISGVIILSLQLSTSAEAQVGTGGHWWALVGTGGHWWALVGTGGNWCVVLEEQLDESLQNFED